MSFLGAICRCNNNINIEQQQQEREKIERIERIEREKTENIEEMKKQIEKNKTSSILMTPQLSFLKDQIVLLTTNLEKQTEKTIKIFGIETDIAIIRNDLGYLKNNINEIKQLINQNN